MQAATDHAPRLLAIDDSTLIHRLLKARLRQEYVEIHSALTAEEGVALARSLRPDVILLDSRMPDASGYVVLRDLQSFSETHDIPVIILSASANTAEKVRALDMGAHDFIAKPFEIAELKARVRSAVRLHRVMTMLAQRAQIDGLTGLWNRTYLNDQLTREIADSERHGTALSLIMCDLDHFKNVNDCYGHPFGDRVLQRVAHLLSDGRSGDVASRYGGEEFIIILPRTAADEAARVAERLRCEIRDVTWDADADVLVTASFGVTDLDLIAEPTLAAMIDAVDAALYAAKQAGRDCVRVTPKPGRRSRLSA
jgi:diguanylate cyclase (GGDEF)-like protein